MGNYLSYLSYLSYLPYLPYISNKETNNKISCDRYTERIKMIDSLGDENNLPKDVNNIIKYYSTPELKKLDINFNFGNDIFHPSEKYELGFRFIADDKCYRKSIHRIINLNNGLLLSGSLSGLIQIWDPSTGKCVKEIYSLEKIFDKNIFMKVSKKITILLEEICQVTDNLIIISYRDLYCPGGNIIYALNIDNNNIKIIHKNAYSHHIFRISHDSFVTIDYQCILVWYIISDTEIEIENIRKKMIHKLWLDSPNFLMVSDNRMIVASKIPENRTTSYILSIDLETNEESYYLLPKHHHIYDYYIVNDYLFLSLTDAADYIDEHIVLNIYTLDVVKKLNEFRYKHIKIIHLKENLIALITSASAEDDTNENNKYNKIIIMNIDKYKYKYKYNSILPDQSYDSVQDIYINGNSIYVENINIATSYQNGLVTVSDSSVISLYEFI